MSTRTTSQRLRRRLGLSVVLLVGPGTAAAIADGPAVKITWSINGQPANVAWQDGWEQGEGSYGYAGTAIDPVTGFELSYDLVADPYLSLGGNMSILNDSGSPIDVSIEVIMEFTPTFLKGSQLSGNVVVGLTTGPDGGMVSSQPPALWQAYIDGATVGPASWLFYDPFFMSSGGQGSATTQQNFGIPVPVAGPPLSQSLGYALNFSLTSLDYCSITCTFTATGEALTCPGDLDISGSVGTADFILLLANWGPCTASCEADLDGDNEVGIVDLLALLAIWGPCQ